MRGFRVGITLGDPGGIGPEIVRKLLLFPPPEIDASIVVFGPMEVLTRELEAASGSGAVFRSVDVGGPLPRLKRGAPSAENGRASFAAFEAAVAQAEAGEIDALVTAPISKKSWDLAGLPWAGHTEYLHQRHSGAIMTFWSENMKVALLTHHLSLRKALDRIRKDRLLDFLVELDSQMKNQGCAGFRYAVSGLNPHAGESGILGSEEMEEIMPAVRAALEKGVAAEGPYPPDVIFRLFRSDPRTMIVALYHDQGLIPFKLDAFETGVNVTLGLPFVRTSPDHGTAFDIVGRNRADVRSLDRAVRLACDFVRSRRDAACPGAGRRTTEPTG